MKRFLHITCLAFILLILSSHFTARGQGQDPEDKEPVILTRILFLFDGSQSMYARWQSDQKINIAREILSSVLDTLSRMKNLEVALRVYGHQHKYPPQVCDDTKLEVPFGKGNFKKITNRLQYIRPNGTSPIAYSLEQSAGDFPPCDNCRNIIVLITDGIEECGGDPCEVSRYLQQEGVVLKPFIIGIGRNFEEVFNCVGTYFDASSEVQFSQALNAVISRALNPTSIQVNLIDSYGRPTETNVAMSFYDHISGKLKYAFIHTMNVLGLPDTMIVDPLITYDLVIHTVPPVKADSIFITPGKHNIIPVNAPQGFLNLVTDTKGNLSKGLQCIVRRNGSRNTVNVQDFGSTQKYLTGVYDLEVLSLPRMEINDVQVTQNHTTSVEVPLPGIAVIQKNTKGFGGIYVEKEGRLEWVYSFREDQSQQESLILMPGSYHVIFRSRYVGRAMYTIDKPFEVKSGLTTNVKLF